MDAVDCARPRVLLVSPGSESVAFESSGLCVCLCVGGVKVIRWWVALMVLLSAIWNSAIMSHLLITQQWQLEVGMVVWHNRIRTRARCGIVIRILKLPLRIHYLHRGALEILTLFEDLKAARFNADVDSFYESLGTFPPLGPLCTDCYQVSL